MNRSIALLLSLALAAPACGTYNAWSKRREARDLERSIETQKKKLEAMSPDALERAEAESREKAIAQYEKILDEYSDVGREEMDEALYLLGRLLFEREQQEFQRKQQSFEDVVARAEAAGATPPEEPRPRYPSAKAVFERLLRDFPDSSLREDALYDLGYILFEEGDRKRGVEHFRTLVAEHPRSRYAAEVHFRLGEYAFESYDLAGAEDHYRAVLRHGQTDLTEKALFKLGWVYYNLDRYDDAKTVLADLLQREAAKVEKEGREFAPAPILFFPGPRRAVLKSPEPKGSDLYQETLEIVARVFSESGGAGELLRFIRSQRKGGKSQPYAAPLMHRLALVEKERAKFEEAARAYELLLDTFPTFRDAPKIELELVEVLMERKELDRAARVREAMLEKYDTGSPWARANPEQEVREEAFKAARKGLSWSIRYHHARGLEEQQASGGVPADLRRAIELYEKYLRRFPEGKPSYVKRFRYAQALFAAAEYQRAADAFREVAFDERWDQRRDEAAFARILSLEKLVEGRKPPLPKPLVETFVASYEDYITLNPASDKNAALLFKQGQLWFEAAEYPPAIAAFTRLIDAYPSDPLAAEANAMLAQAHFRLKDFTLAERWSELALGKSGGAALGERRGEIENLFALTVFRQGEEAEEKGDWEEARKHYMRLVDGAPANENAPRALYNAAAATEKAGRPEEAARLFERLLAEYVESDLAPDAAIRLAAWYEKQPGGSDALIRMYERVADSHMQSPHAEEFLFLAGQLAAREKKGPETVRLFEKYLSRYRSDGSDVRGERTLLALYHLGSTYSSGGNDLLARANFEQFLSRPRPAKTTFGEEGEGYAFASAKAQLLLANAVEQEYARVRIEPPIKETFSRKERLLLQVVERYAQPVASGLSPIATEASYRIGAAYEEFARALEAAPKPAGLSAEELGEYDRLLEEQTRPYLKKAVSAWRVTVRASREKSIDDEWVAKCRERLAVVAPRAFVRPPRPEYVSLAPTADAAPELLQTFGGAPAPNAESPGFLGSLVANDDDARKAAFAEGLKAAAKTPPAWGEAAAHFRKAADGGPPEAGYNAAVAASRQGDATAAIGLAEDAVRRYPAFQPALHLAASLYDQAGQRDLAASYYRRAGEAAQATAPQRVAWGSFLERQGRRDDAIAAYRSALALDSGNGAAVLALVRLGETASGDDLGPLIPSLSGSPSLLVELGILAAERGQMPVAARAFAVARPLVPSGSRRELAAVINNEALAAQAMGEVGRAEALLSSALQVDPTLPALQNTAGILQMKRGEYQSAETEFRKALESAPSASTPWANLGILNELYFGMPEVALECYTRYLATRPEDGELVSGWVQELREGMSDRSA